MKKCETIKARPRRILKKGTNFLRPPSLSPRFLSFVFFSNSLSHFISFFDLFHQQQQTVVKCLSLFIFHGPLGFSAFFSFSPLFVLHSRSIPSQRQSLSHFSFFLFRFFFSLSLFHYCSIRPLFVCYCTKIRIHTHLPVAPLHSTRLSSSTLSSSILTPASRLSKKPLLHLTRVFRNDHML